MSKELDQLKEDVKEQMQGPQRVTARILILMAECLEKILGEPEQND